MVVLRVKKISTQNLLLLVLGVLLLSIGCAHGPKAISSAEDPDVSIQQDPQPTPPETGDSASARRDNPDSSFRADEDDDDDDYLDEVDPGYIADPLEPWNRAMFHFNDKFYLWVLKPVAKGYRAVMPQFVRTGIDNFFYNLAMPVRFTGCILQGKALSAAYELTRFFLNTTVGVLGFGNPAKDDPNLNPPEEDIGQALGSYGIGNGFYIVWPFLGPSSLRDSIGAVGDYFLTPLSYLDPLEARLAVRAVKEVNWASFRIGDYEAIKDAAFAPYEAFRDAYVQYRKKKVEE